MKNNIKKCCICGEHFEGWGNNPAPVMERGECCEFCNRSVVIPTRIELHRQGQTEEQPMKGGI